MPDGDDARQPSDLGYVAKIRPKDTHSGRESQSVDVVSCGWDAFGFNKKSGAAMIR